MGRRDTLGGDEGYLNHVLGVAYVRMGRLSDGLHAYRAGLKSRPDDAEIWYDLGTLYDRVGRVEDAVSAFRRVIELDPDMASAYNYIGYSYAERGINLIESVELIEKALERSYGNQVMAAKMLGLNRNTLHTKIKKFYIDIRRFKR